MPDFMTEFMGRIEKIRQMNADLERRIKELDDFKAYCRLLDWRMRSICSLALVIVLFVFSFGK